MCEFSLVLEFILEDLFVKRVENLFRNLSGRNFSEVALGGISGDSDRGVFSFDSV